MHAYTFRPAIEQKSFWFTLPNEIRIEVLHHLFKATKYRELRAQHLSRDLLSIILVSKNFVDREAASKILLEHNFWSMEVLPGYKAVEHGELFGRLPRLKPSLDGNAVMPGGMGRIKNVLVKVGIRNTYQVLETVSQERVRYFWQVLLAPNFSSLTRKLAYLQHITVKIVRQDARIECVISPSSDVFRLATASQGSQEGAVRCCYRCDVHRSDNTSSTTVEELSTGQAHQQARSLVHTALSLYGADSMRSVKKLLVAAKTCGVKVSFLLTFNLVSPNCCCEVIGILAEFDLNDKLLQFYLGHQKVVIPQEIPENFFG